MLIAEHGGAPGILDAALLESALASPQNHFAYEKCDLFRLAAAYAHALTRDHPFADGNKRVALTVCGVFLELNGVRLEALEPEAARVMWALSAGELDEAGFAQWLRESATALRVRKPKAPRKPAAKRGAPRKKK
jgi:death-on-curing protein